MNVAIDWYGTQNKKKTKKEKEKRKENTKKIVFSDYQLQGLFIQKEFHNEFASKLYIVKWLLFMQKGRKLGCLKLHTLNLCVPETTHPTPTESIGILIYINWPTTIKKQKV